MERQKVAVLCCPEFLNSMTVKNERDLSGTMLFSYIQVSLFTSWLIFMLFASYSSEFFLVT